MSDLRGVADSMPVRRGAEDRIEDEDYVDHSSPGTVARQQYRAACPPSVGEQRRADPRRRTRSPRFARALEPAVSNVFVFSLRRRRRIGRDTGDPRPKTYPAHRSRRYLAAGKEDSFPPSRVKRAAQGEDQQPEPFNVSVARAEQTGTDGHVAGHRAWSWSDRRRSGQGAVDEAL